VILRLFNSVVSLKTLDPTGLILFMIALYHQFLYQPLLNVLILFYDLLGDFGLSIILLTIVVRLVLYPVAKKTMEHQKKLRKIQPKLKELQKKHKDDKEKLTQEMMALYKEHEFNPASGCLPLVVQFIILIALYRVFISGIHLDVNQLYGWVPKPTNFSTTFLGLFDLGQKAAELNLGKLFKLDPSGFVLTNWGGLMLALMAGAAQFVQTKMTVAIQAKKKAAEPPKPEEEKEKKDESAMPDMSEMMNKQMLYFFPLLTVYIGLSFPAGLALYWTTSTLLLIAQQWLLDRKDK
jgi:YidC/Oxa1 family membrane protein insertase